MTNFGIRYDLRCPDFAKSTSAELCAALIEQCVWADRLGFDGVTLSEHHGSSDGYLPSPLVLAGAVASRTEQLKLRIAALIVPLHDPIRIAEDLAMLDVISNGRVQVVVSGGYVASEFAMFGKELKQRGRLVEQAVAVLEQAWTGEPFEYRGTTVRVTPRPVQRPRPPILMGGSSNAAARRAARMADYFVPTQPEYFEVFRQEREKLGKPDLGPMPRSFGSFLHVSENPDADWARIAPHAMHEMNAYGQWAAESGTNTGYQPIADADALRATGLYPVLTPDEVITKARALGPTGSVTLHPLCGGMDPELAWESLRLVESKVMPALADA